MTGTFIVFEGGDGAGKTTQSELLASWLRSEGRTVVETREPGGTSLGGMIRQLLLHTDTDISARAEALLYAADRAQHVAEVVRPALERGEVVVQDRFVDSSLAYQGAGRVLNVEEVRSLSEWATEGLTPALTVLLDVSPKTGVERRSSARKKADRLEREPDEFHREVRNGFLRLAQAHPERYLVLDAAENAQAIHRKIVARVRPIISPRSR